MSLLGRISLWFISLILGVATFSLFVGMGSAVFVFRIAMMFAFPVWCLYLPFILFLADANGRRAQILLLSGILIGPAALTVGVSSISNWEITYSTDSGTATRKQVWARVMTWFTQPSLDSLRRRSMCFS
jgi:hypothetical protein